MYLAPFPLPFPLPLPINPPSYKSPGCEIIGAGTSITACQPMYAYMNDQTSSYQIYNGCCTLYTDGNCQGQSNYHCSGPGGTYYFSDLAGTGFNDRYSSFKCSSQY
jgi:hypothetical protein